MKRSLWMTSLLIVAGATALVAQPPARPEGQGGPGGDRPPGGPGGPRPPLVSALDADDDNVITAEEMAAAPTALKKLDKNGDGKLTEDEFRPARLPQGGPGQGGPQGGPQGRGQ